MLGWVVLFGLWAIGTLAICFLLWAVYQVELKPVTTMGKEPTPSPFNTGDWVVLKEKNPFKGTLRCGEPYEVLGVTVLAISLRADNGTEGWFYPTNFELYTGLGRRMPIDLSRDYEDALAAQEIMDDLQT